MVQGNRVGPDRIAVPLNLALVGAGEDESPRARAFREVKRFVELRPTVVLPEIERRILAAT